MEYHERGHPQVSLCFCTAFPKSRLKISRQLRAALHSSKPGQVLNFYKLFIGDSSAILLGVLKNYFSGIVKLSIIGIPHANHVADILVDWMLSFDTPEYLVTNQLTYFIRTILNPLTERKHIVHHFIIYYVHYPNFKIEVINELVQQAFQDLVSELSWKKSE